MWLIPSASVRLYTESCFWASILIPVGVLSGMLSVKEMFYIGAKLHHQCQPIKWSLWMSQYTRIFLQLKTRFDKIFTARCTSANYVCLVFNTSHRLPIFSCVHRESVFDGHHGGKRFLTVYDHFLTSFWWMIQTLPISEAWYLLSFLYPQ